MAPSAVYEEPFPYVPGFGYGSNKNGATQLAKPLISTGSLDHYKSFDVTKVIGREFPDLQLSSILHDDAKVRDLAITGLLRCWLIHH